MEGIILIEGQLNLFDFLKEEEARVFVCKYSKHTCNKAELWKVASTLDDIKCPEICCRYCKQSILCGACCNGTQRREVDLYGFMDDGKCPNCGNKQLEDLQNQCEECGQMLSWEGWKQANKDIWRNNNE